MYEASGVLAPVVATYLRGGSLDGHGLDLMKAYLTQWMAGDWRADNPADIEGLRHSIATIRSQRDLRRWLAIALEYAIDPL